MRALILLTAATGVGLLVTWFWREQARGRVEPMPPLVAQLEKLVEQGALGGQTPEGLVATLVFSEPFQEADPWDLAPARRSSMAAWFGEPRQLAFTEALGREERTAVWRLDAGSPDAQASAQAQASAAAAWAASKGVRLRAVAHGRALDPVLRAALAAPAAKPPVFERVLGVGVRLADLKARDPALAQALAAGPPAGQWLNLYSDPSMVPRALVLETVGPGPEARAEETAWPGSSWVATVTGLAARGAAEHTEALPALTPQGMVSVRQFRSVKDGRVTQRVVDGKGNLVSGSLIVPKLEKDEIPPDPEAGEKVARPGTLVPIMHTGWRFRVPEGLKPAHTDFNECAGTCLLLEEPPFSISLSVDPHCFGGRAHTYCNGQADKLVTIAHRGYPAEVCKQPGVRAGTDDSDEFTLHDGERCIELSYNYPRARRDEKLDLFMHAIEALEPPGPAK